MMLVSCYLGKSKIEGFGVFTRVDIAKGAEVWRFDQTFDILVPNDVLATAPEHVRTFYAHYAHYAYEVADFPEHMALDGDDGRFMNHSDTPNLDFSTPGVATALRSIGAGEELTCDYHHLATKDFEMEPSRNAI